MLRPLLWPVLAPPLRRIGTPARRMFSPLALFAAGEQGVWFDPSDFGTLFQDSAGTTPVTAAGQPVGKILDKSGRGNHATQATATSRFTLQQDASGYYYFALDGVDDGAATGSINFTATNQMTVFAGVYKASDAATGCVVELSADASTNNGGFNVFAPVAPSQSYRFGSRGTATASGGPALAAFPAPHAAVLTCRGSIAADLCSISVNAGTPTLNAADQGTGNYSTWPIYIGRRGGTSVPFNGRIYSLIVRGAASSADQVASIERWIGSRMGIAL